MIESLKSKFNKIVESNSLGLNNIREYWKFKGFTFDISLRNNAYNQILNDGKIIQSTSED